MNTLLKIAALITAAATPVAFVLEANGITLPSAISASHVFGAFIAIVTVMTMLADYSGAKLVGSKSVAVATKSQSALALAA